MLELLTGANEAERDRLLVLEATKLVDSPASDDFDRVTRLAAELFRVPVALITLVTEDRQWFMSKVGMDVCETEREAAFCHHTIQTKQVMVVPDATLDRRFCANRLVTGAPAIRFYAGAPLITASGHALGSLCIIDNEPRTFLDRERALLEDLAAMVMRQIELTVSVGRINEITKLPNRAQLQSDLNDLQSVSDPGTRALVLLDIMGASQVQAAVLALGVGALERFLAQVSRRLAALLPSNVTLYHTSDTRFSFLLPADHGDLDKAVRKMVASMIGPFELEGICFKLDVRCGAVRFDPVNDRVVDLLRMATSALVQRGEEEDRLHWFVQEYDLAHRRTYALVRTIPEGLRNNEFRLVYQPKYDVATQRHSGVEALLRWTHPVMGVISPAEFIPAIEKTQTIHQVTSWVLETALAQMALWQASGLFIKVAINVSGRNLEQPDFADSVRRACAALR